MAAYKNGIKTVIIPYDNISDLEEVDAAVKEAITFMPVKHVSEVLDIVLVRSAQLRGGEQADFVPQSGGFDSEIRAHI